MSVQEPLYTLDEAKRLLAVGTCLRIGHDLEIFVVDKSIDPVAITCTRCGEGWAVVKKEDSK
jgi:hypothetical protein